MEQKYITVCVLIVLLGSPVEGVDVWCYGGAVILGVSSAVLAPFALGAAGFGSAGIVAGSLAAKAMTATAAANGGGVVAGSVLATLQSAGVVGIGVGAKAAIGTTVGGIYAYFAGGCTAK